MKTEAFWLAAKDKVQLFTRAWLPDGSPLAVVQIAHGMCEHSLRYAPVAEALVKAGFAVVAMDRRGHGQTAQKPEDLGYFAPHNGWNLVLEDLLTLTQQSQKQYPNIPHFLLGHSQGSFLAQHYLIKYGKTVQGVILSGTNGPVGPMLTLAKIANAFERWRQGPFGKSLITLFLSFGAYNLAFRPNRTPFDWLSRNPAAVDAFMSDPLCGFMCTNQFWKDFADGLTEIEKKENIALIPKNIPILVIAGSEDPVGRKTKGVTKLIKAYQHAGINSIEQHFYPGARHEIFNEINREEVYQDVVHWLNKHLKT